MSLPELLDKISQKEKVANLNIEEIHPSTRPGMGVAINQAKTELVNLKSSYINELLNKCVAFLVEGSDKQVQDFVNFSKEESGAITLDVNEMYVRISKTIERSMGKNWDFTTSQHFLLISEVKELMSGLGIVGLDAPRFQNDKTVNNPQSLLSYIKESIRSTSGDALNIEFLKSKLGSLALTAGHKEGILPVIVVGASDPTESKAFLMLFKKGIVPVVISEEVEVTREYVVDVFKNANKTLKKTKKENVNGQ